MNLSPKLIITTLLLGLIPLLFVSGLSYYQTRSMLMTHERQRLEIIADLEMKTIAQYVSDLQAEVITAQNNSSIMLNIPVLAQHRQDPSHPDAVRARATLDRHLQAWMAQRPEDTTLLLTDASGTLLYTSNSRHVTQALGTALPAPYHQVYVQGRTTVFLSDFLLTDDSNNPRFFVSAPIHDMTGALLGVEILRVNGNELRSMLQDTTGLGKTGEMLLVEKRTEGVVLLTPRRHEPSGGVGQTVVFSTTNALPLQHAANGENGFGVSVDYRNKDILAVWRGLSINGWGLVVKLDMQELLAPATALGLSTLLIDIITALCVVLFTWLMARDLTRPLRELSDIAKQIGAGHLDVTIGEHLQAGDDEVALLAQSTNVMREKVRQSHENLEATVQSRTAALAQQVAETKKFQLAVESSNDSIVMTDEHGTILYVNPRWEKQTGYSKAEAIGNTPRMLKSGGTPPRIYEDMWRSLHSSQLYRTDGMVNKRKDGSLYFANLSVYPIVDPVYGRFFVGVQSDITQEKKESRAKSELVSIASHQLRTPLTAIRWALERLQKKDIPHALGEEADHLVTEALLATRTMAQTIGAMLSISRIEAGKMTPEYQEIHLCDALADIHQELQQSITDAGLHSTVECGSNWTVMTDPALLKQIIRNLLMNAICYTPAGGSVTVRVREQTDGISIDVADTGFGIPADQQDKIFEKFFRGDNVLDKVPNGNGLGLYLVKNLADILGASVRFVSATGTGTTFTVSFPKHRNAA